MNAPKEPEPGPGGRAARPTKPRQYEPAGRIFRMASKAGDPFARREVFIVGG
jgi:hypothetical protein